MKLAPILAVALSVPLPIAAQSGPLTSLDGLRDHARPLLIFAAKPDDPLLQIQLRRLQQDAPAVSDRDIVPIAIPYQSPASTPVALTADAAAAVRRQFRVGPTEFVVILLGKDGGEKLRSSKPFSMRTLRATIDAMPMRQDEMRGKAR